MNILVGLLDDLVKVIRSIELSEADRDAVSEYLDVIKGILEN